MSEEEDVLLGALRELPKPDTSGAAQDRARREVRGAFQRAKSGRSSLRLGSFAVPAVLAAVIFVYLGWAISTVNALAQ